MLEIGLYKDHYFYDCTDSDLKLFTFFEWHNAELKSVGNCLKKLFIDGCFIDKEYTYEDVMQ